MSETPTARPFYRRRWFWLALVGLYLIGRLLVDATLLPPEDPTAGFRLGATREEVAAVLGSRATDMTPIRRSVPELELEDPALGEAWTLREGLVSVYYDEDGKVRSKNFTPRPTIWKRLRLLAWQTTGW